MTSFLELARCITENQHKEACEQRRPTKFKDLSMPDQPATPMSHAASKSRPYNAAVEAILLDRFPTKPLVDMAEAIAQMGGEATANPFAEILSADVEAQREKLLALPATELNALYARLRQKLEVQRIARAADDKAKKEAKAAAKEAAKFYNQPNAQADFTFWMKADYWTLEEALALLLGRNPKLVTSVAMKRELEPGFEFLMTSSQRPPLPEFVEQYQRLRMLAERASVLKSPHLNPVEVIAWAHRVQAVSIPASLRSLLPLEQSDISRDPEPDLPVKGDRTTNQDVLNAPGNGTPKKWTPEKLRELATHRVLNGTLAAAAEFGISEARVRQLLPKEPPESKKSAKSRPRGPWAGL